MKIKRYKKDKNELFYYLIVGVLTSLINFGVYCLWKILFHISSYPEGSLNYFLIINSGQIISFWIATIFSFFANKKYVFDVEFTQKKILWKKFFLFVLSRISGTLLLEIGLFNLIIAVFATKFSFIDIFAKISMSIAVTIFNYAISKFAIFKKAEHK